jgi:predicted acetyltransferase
VDRIRPVTDDQWPVVAWLWQAFRHDLALIANGMPYADGRYQAAKLDTLPSPDGAGYLAWHRHPNTGDDAPVGFVVVTGLTGDRRSVLGFWVTPVVRRSGVGRELAITALTSHPGPWSIGFQHENSGAGRFWRAVADEAFGQGTWRQRRQPVPRGAGAPDDHIIEAG